MEQAFKWIQSHTNSLGEVGRQLMYLAISFGLIHVTPEQQMQLLQAGSAILALIVGGNIVAKVRVGERINEEVEKRTNGNGTGTFRSPITSSGAGLVLLLVMFGSLMSCSKAAPVLVATDAGVHASLLSAKTGIDKLCSASSSVLSVETCKSLYTTLTPALEAGRTFNRLARDKKFEGLADLASKISRLMEAVRLIPERARGSLESDLTTALGFAVK